MADECKPIEVARRIEAPAGRIFEILANPQRHVDFDGSDMLRGAVTTAVVSGVGEIFSMKMYFEPLGDYVMLNHIFEYEPNRRIGWEPAPGDAASAQDGALTEIYDCAAAPEQLRVAVRNGATWVDAMTTSLARLDTLCSDVPDQQAL